jgi:hypothetical protein
VIEGEGVSGQDYTGCRSRRRADAQMPAYHDVPTGDMYLEYTVVLPSEVKPESRHREWRRAWAWWWERG